MPATRFGLDHRGDVYRQSIALVMTTTHDNKQRIHKNKKTNPKENTLALAVVKHKKNTYDK